MCKHPFEPGDRFWIASVRGVHFTTISVDGAEVEAVDQNRRPWDIEADGDSLHIHGARGPSLGRRVEIEEVNFH